MLPLRTFLFYFTPMLILTFLLLPYGPPQTFLRRTELVNYTEGRLHPFNTDPGTTTSAVTFR